MDQSHSIYKTTTKWEDLPNIDENQNTFYAVLAKFPTKLLNNRKQARTIADVVSEPLQYLQFHFDHSLTLLFISYPYFFSSPFRL